MGYSDYGLDLADPTGGIPLKLAKTKDGATDVDFHVDDNGFLKIAEGSSSWSPARWYDVRAYGATGDGTTDDTSAIQSAIDACKLASGVEGGVVYFPPGIYMVSGLTVDADNGADNTRGVVLRGAGMRATILKLIASSDADVIAFKSTDTVAYQVYSAVEHLQIDGNGANNAAGSGISFAYSFDNVVRSCYITECVDAAIEQGTSSTNLWIDHCIIRTNDGKGVEVTDAQAVVISDSNIERNGGIGVHVIGSPDSGFRKGLGNLSLRGNYLEYNTTAEVQVEDALGVFVQGCYMIGTDPDTGAYDHPCVVLDNADHITLRDLTFVGSTSTVQQDWISITGQPPSYMTTERVYTAISANELWQSIGRLAKYGETLHGGLEPGLPQAFNSPYLGIMQDGTENVLTDSKDLSGADSWSTSNATLSTASATNPFGDTETISKVVFSGGASSSSLGKGVVGTPTTGDVYTAIAVLKADAGDEGKTLRLEFQQSGATHSRTFCVLTDEWQTFVCKVKAENTNQINFYLHGHPSDGANGGSSTYDFWCHDIAIVKSESIPCLLPTDNGQTPDVGGVRCGTNFIAESVVLRPMATPTPVAEGMIVYDSSANKLKVYTGAGWETITSS